jgi:hypothetical protein
LLLNALGQRDFDFAYENGWATFWRRHKSLQRESPGNQPGPPYTTKAEGGEALNEPSLLSQDRAEFLRHDFSEAADP